MSWQVYVDSNLVGSGKVTKAAILGQQGGVWATTPGFTIAADEQKYICNMFNDVNNTQANGVRIGGTKYFAISVDPKHCVGKQGPNGCDIRKTKQAIIVAVYNAPIQAPECTNVVEGVADYLESTNY
ncbi:profilin, required for normal timing of actin polymerization in response to thermal stress [Tulasnella sp. JGI-2019a]|nr:profilin, required for normal timing of actin polymerization in response to thermal stress [Tulasnella sp. JGI-2019a]KAG8992528.1 profilin, required for normal timing of actin polymerization in response to thermal stress [Tulasnella sp. JGI-2019a]KAG9029632.1 profilin, required for normal timing of actin polymerization in response to thermal stress [Tulasnella sp. JGI-2019a]